MDTPYIPIAKARGFTAYLVISVHLNDNEKALLNEAAELFQCKISSLMKKLTFAKLEDEYDMLAIKEYEKEKDEGTLELFAFDDVMKELDT